VLFIRRLRLTLNPERIFPRLVEAASYAFLGRENKAKNALDIFFSMFPVDLMSAQYLYSVYPFEDQKDFNRILHGLIKAGFSRDTKYYIIEKQNKLNGNEITKFVMGKKNVLDYFGTHYRSKDGVIKSPQADGSVFMGKSWIENDMLCDQYEKFLDGFKNCSDIYRNPNITEKTPKEFIAMSYIALIPFSVEELE